MAVEDAGVGVVEDGSLDTAVEQGVGLAHEELVERVFGGDEDSEAVTRAAGSAPLLPEAGDGAREAHADHAVEQADVDSELERVRGADAEQFPFDQAPLDLAALGGGVAGAIRGEPGRIAEALRGESVDELGCLAALGEAESPSTSLDERCHQAGGLTERARAQSQLLVGERRVPEGDRPLRLRRGVSFDHGGLDAEQSLRELAWVGDRRRSEEELRVGAVDAREAA